MATSLDKIKQLMKVSLPSKAYLTMYNLPAKPIKGGIKVWMGCDGDTPYLHQCEVYLGQEQISKFGLGYYVVMKLCKEVSGKKSQVYCNNLFTSVQLLMDLLACKTYCNETIQMNKKYL